MDQNIYPCLLRFLYKKKTFYALSFSRKILQKYLVGDETESPRLPSNIVLLIKNIPIYGLNNANISYVSETKSMYTSKSSETYFPSSLSSTNSSTFSLWSVLQLLFNCSYIILKYVSESQKRKDFCVGLLNSNGVIICSKIIVLITLL